VNQLAGKPTRRDRSNIAVARFFGHPTPDRAERVPTASNVGSRDVTWASQPQPLIPFRVFSRVSRTPFLRHGSARPGATARRQKRAQRLAEPKNDHREKPVSARYRRSRRESEQKLANETKGRPALTFRQRRPADPLPPASSPLTSHL
jgi:hypothetical protein